MKRTTVFVIVVGIIVLITGIVGTFLFIQHSVSDFPPNVLSSTNFTVFGVRGKPGGFSLNKESPRYQSGVLVFSLSNEDGKHLAFTEQVKPTNYDFSALKGNQQIQTDYGKASLSIKETYSAVSLVTDKVWVIIRSDKPVDTTNLQAVVEALKPLN